MSKRRTFYDHNQPELKALIDELGLEYEPMDGLCYRIYGATHVIDIWMSRMVAHRIKGEDIKAKEPYVHLDERMNRAQVEKLLLTGQY